MQKVDEDLLQPDTAAEHFQVLIRQHDIQRIHLPGKAAAQQHDRTLDDQANADRFGGGAALPGQYFQVAGNRADALGQRRDVFEIFGGLGHAVAFQQRAGIIGKGADRRHRLIDLVRHTRRHLPQDGKAVGLHQLVLHITQLAGGFFMQGDFGLQVIAGSGQVAGAFLHLHFQLSAGTLFLFLFLKRLVPAPQPQGRKRHQRHQRRQRHHPALADCGVQRRRHGLQIMQGP
ncbi:hypothetical protein D3C72_965140 [compost metagenome]